MQVKRLGPVPVKGLEHAIDVYEIVGAGPARSRLQATSGRGLTRFVGRQTELGDIDLQVDARYVLAQTHYWLGDYPRARELLSRNVETLATGDWRHVASAFLQPVSSRAWLAMTLASLGDFDEGIRHGEEAIRIAESDGRPLVRVIAQSSLGLLHLARGDVDRAIALLERSLALHRTWGLVDWRESTTAFLGYAYALSGRPADGIPMIQDALEADRASLGQPDSFRARLYGEVYLIEGNIGRALECARQALELARRQQARGYEAWTLHLLGEIALRGEPPDASAAEANYREALALAERLGMRPLVALCHLRLCQMSRRAGQPVQARHLSAAVTLLTDMKMRFWLAEAEAELKAVPTPSPGC